MAHQKPNSLDQIKHSIDKISEILGGTEQGDKGDKKTLRGLLNQSSAEWEKFESDTNTDLPKNNRWDLFTDYFANMVSACSTAVSFYEDYSEHQQADESELKECLRKAIAKYEPRSYEFSALKGFINLDTTTLENKKTVIALLDTLENEKNTLVRVINNYLGSEVTTQKPFQSR